MMGILADPLLSENEVVALTDWCATHSLTGFTTPECIYGISFHLIREAAMDMIPHCVYVAQAVGIKEAWLHSPSASGQLHDNEILLQQIDAGMLRIHSGIKKMVNPGTFASEALTIFLTMVFVSIHKIKQSLLLVPAARFAEQAIAAERSPGKHQSVESERGTKKRASSPEP
jgi:hypothetical protein